MASHTTMSPRYHLHQGKHAWHFFPTGQAGACSQLSIYWILNVEAVTGRMVVKKILKVEINDIPVQQCHTGLQSPIVSGSLTHSGASLSQQHATKA